jgi:transposase
VLSGIIHVLQSGCRWRDCPPEYGPRTTLYNRWNRWSRRAVWRRLFEALREVSEDAFHSIDSTTAKAHRSAAGGKGGGSASYRPVPWRADDQDPRALRCTRTPCRH